MPHIYYSESGTEDMDIRLGFVGIVVRQMDSASEVNRVLSQYGEIIRGRIGVPSQTEKIAVIGLIVEGDNNRIGALTGKLGNIPGITVKSALTSATSGKSENERK